MVAMWTMMPDNIIVRLYTLSVPAIKDCQQDIRGERAPKGERMTKGQNKRVRKEAQDKRDARQIAFKLVCKAWLQGAGHSISKGQLGKADLPHGKLPAGLHQRFGGVQTLSLNQVKLGCHGFQVLGNLPELHHLSLIDIDGHFSAIGQAVVCHFRMNVTKAGKPKPAEADRTQIQLMAALPYSDRSILPTYGSFSPQSFASGYAAQTEVSRGHEARNRPFVCFAQTRGQLQAGLTHAQTQAQAHALQSPFGFLRALTSLTLQQYPLARLPTQDLQGMSLLTNLKSLTLTELWAVTVPYDTLGSSLSSLTALSLDTSQSQRSMQLLPAVTSLQHLTVTSLYPSISQFWPFGAAYSAWSALSRLELYDVDDITREQLASLSLFRALQHLVVKGKQQKGPEGYQHWRIIIEWEELKALTGVKHLELINIDHRDNIFDSLSTMAQLTHLTFSSLQNLYHSPLADGLMQLASFPHLDHLHCEFLRFQVRSGLCIDLESEFRQRRKLPMSHLKVHIEEVEDMNEDDDSDDVESEIAYDREMDRQREQNIQAQYQLDYDSDERDMHRHDRDMYNGIMRQYYS